MRYLYLDDVRQPSQSGLFCEPELIPLYNKEKWDIVRNYHEFVAWIELNGLPDVISFDHDLADVHYHAVINQEEIRYLEHTGYHCAKWLCDYCIDNNLKLPQYYVHSMNPIGALNIMDYLKQFKEFQEKQTLKQ